MPQQGALGIWGPLCSIPVYGGSDGLLDTVYMIKSGDKTRPLGQSFQNSVMRGDLENLICHTQFIDHCVAKHLKKELSSLENKLLYFIKSVPHFLILFCGDK